MEDMEVDSGIRPFLCGRCNNSITKPLSEVEVSMDTEASVVQCVACSKCFKRDPNVPGNVLAMSDSKTYQCARCDELFDTQTELMDHMEEKHSKEHDLVCDVCNKTFFSHGNLYRHKKLHSTSKPFPCDICHKSYATEPYLKAHMWEHVSDRPFQCDVCNKRFPLLVHLKRHASVHVTRNAYVCDICERHFPSTGNLRRHKQTHVLYECQVCARRYPKLDHLKEHMMEHMENRPFECDVCDRHFTTEVLLKAHAWVHTREKFPFSCKTCKARFTLSRDLKEHNQTTHDEAPPPRGRKAAKMYSIDRDEGICDDEGEEEEAPSLLERPDRPESPNEPLEIKYVYEPNKRYQCGVCHKWYKTLRIRNQHQLLHADGKPHTCDICGATFTTRTNMRRHRQTHNKQNPHACSVCGKTYKTAGGLKTHLWEHSQDRPYLCPHCGKAFSMKDHMKRHMIIHDESKKHKCEVCPMTFSQSQNLKRHQATHAANLKHRCPMCATMFKTVSEMRRHLEDHKGVKKYECKLCQRKYATEAILKSHMWSHAEKRFNCKVCDKHYASSFFLRRHMTSHAQHERESAFQCDLCRKRFLKQGNFRLHMVAHSRKSWPRCPVCNTSLQTLREVDRHVTRNHPASRAVPCTHCDQHFQLTRERDHHVDAAHPEKARPFKCDTCGESFKTEDDVTVHQTTHGVEEPFKCKSCEMRFKTKLALVVHLRNHDARHMCKYCKQEFPTLAKKQVHVQSMDDDVHKPFICDVCNKGFTTKQRVKRHVLLHTGEKPYKCTRCGKKFRQNAHLTEHMRSHRGDKHYVCNVCDKRFSHVKAIRCHVDRCKIGEAVDDVGGDMCPCGCRGIADKHDELRACGDVSSDDDTLEADDGKNSVENTSDTKKTVEKDVAVDKVKTVIQTRSKSRRVSSSGEERGEEVSKTVSEERVGEVNESKKVKDSKASSGREAVKACAGVVVVKMDEANVTEESLSCPVCQKTFTSQNKLSHHNRVHLSQTPYRCGMCEATFGDVASMVAHVKKHLNVPVNLKCDLCETNFPNHKFYSNHMEKHALSEHSCPHCHLKFFRKAKLALHVRTKHSQLFYEGNALRVKMQMAAEANIVIKTEPINAEEHEEGAAVLAALASGGNSSQIETTEVINIVQGDENTGKFERDVVHLEKGWKVVSSADQCSVVGTEMVTTGTSMGVVYDSDSVDERQMDSSVTAGEQVQYEVATLGDEMPENYEIVAVMDDSNANQLSELTGTDQILYTTDGQILSTGNAVLDDAVRLIANQTDNDGGTIIIKIEYDDSQ